MQKAIHIDGNGVVKRILSVTDISAVDTSPNGLDYIPVEYVEKPEVVDDTNRDIVYPMYNSETKEMFWQIVNYQNTVDDIVLDNHNLKIQVAKLESSLVEKDAELSSTQAELLDTQMAVAELAELVAGGAE